ncbi:NAD(P)/FAD-dependent oxidoreductase [Vibrio sp.]|uniref:NAD(P)/FAD-dependent oxidoreductase n=1 Tax=Vibrio sp. TaxID=678 RepID=UPI003D142BBB
MDYQTALKKTKFTTFWLDSIELPPAQAPLALDTQCDLLIVGGGFCGLWAAIQAKEINPKRDIVLIEAKEVANGASGRPAGIISTSVMHGLTNTQHNYPNEIHKLEDLGRENMKGFLDTLEKYNIDCDLELGGELTVSIGNEGLQEVKHEHELYIKYGHQSKLLNKQEVQDQIKSPLFFGGAWCQSQSGTVHPGKLCTELKRVALKLGVRVYENTPLENHSKAENGVLVTTPRGKIAAKKVLLATNAFKVKKTKVQNRVAAIRDRILMTEPLSEEQMNRIGWQNRQGIYDTRTQLNYMRLTKDNRILFGGRLAYFFNNNTDPQADKQADPFERLVNAFYETFPMLDDVTFSHAWSGPIALTSRMAVHYQHYHGGDMVYAGGYSGFGVTASRFGARIGLAILDGEDHPATSMTFATTLPTYIPPEPFRWMGAQVTFHALDTCDDKGGWRKPWVKMINAMGFPITHI